MSNIRKFEIYSKQLVQIDKVRPLGSQGTETTTWNWEIQLADSSDDIYMGMAIERKKNALIPWTTLKTHNEFTNEIIEMCKIYMEKNS